MAHSVTESSNLSTPGRPRATRARDAKAARGPILQNTIEQEVIPRLLAAARKRDGEHPVTSIQVKRLMELSQDANPDAASRYVESIRSSGIDAETLYLHLLTPAARMLGEMWEQDRYDFADVTIGVGRLQAVRRLLRPMFLGSLRLTAAPQRRVMLMPLPGEQHVFGLFMLSDFFVRAGWDAWTDSADTIPALEAAVRSDWVDVVGFSFACDDQADAARAAILAVRRASRNQKVIVMAGGPIFVRDPHLVTAVGADGTAADGLGAVQTAESLVQQRAGLQHDGQE